MKHIFDFTYRGHEISILQNDSGYACDVRYDDYDGDWMGGYCNLKTQRQAVTKAIDCVEQYIYDQTHFTAGISI